VGGGYWYFKGRFEGMKLNFNHLVLIPGENFQLNLDTAPCSPILWQSSNPEFVSVSASGQITAISIGNGSISVINSLNRVIDTCHVQVMLLGDILEKGYSHELSLVTGNFRENLTAIGIAMGRFIESHFGFDQDGFKAYYGDLKKENPSYLWDIGIQLASLTALTHTDRLEFEPILTNFIHSTITGYSDGVRVGLQPSFRPDPNNDDRYVDDNAWIGMGLMYAYELTNNSQYLTEAIEIFRFLQEGENKSENPLYDGGIYWHITRNSLHTCSSAPTAYFCFQLSKYLTGSAKFDAITLGNRSLDWCMRVMQDSTDGLFCDNINAITGSIDTRKYTYNTAMVIRALLLRAKILDQSADYAHAVQIANYSSSFINPSTHAYRDGAFFSYLLIEADIEFDLGQSMLQITRPRALATAEYYRALLFDSNAISQISDWHLKDFAAICRIFLLLGNLESK
jgi:hypothetical protein